MSPFQIRILALGSGAGNALNAMVRAGHDPADLIAANTDVQDLKRSLAGTRLQLGQSVTRGLGAAGDLEVGGRAAEADRVALTGALAGADLVVLLAGLGGGTGGGGALVVAEIAASAGAAVVAIVTMPFPFEGRKRQRQAEEALEALRGTLGAGLFVVTTPIPPADSGVTMPGLFALADANVAAVVHEVLAAVRGQTEPTSDALIAIRDRVHR